MTCPRLFQVEALRDGRLGGAERKSFERHLEGCPVCAHEAAVLGQLAQHARGGFDDAQTADELHVWRERSRLLAAFDRALVSPRRTLRIRRLLVWPVTAAVVIAALALFWRGQPVVTPARTAGAAIRADGATIWSRRPGTGGREQLALDRGVLWIHVDHAAGQRPVVVVLPDGELEDVGTTFTVSADGNQTTRVEVEEGKVVLRLRGQPSVEIEAGNVWLPETQAAVRPASAAPPSPVESTPERDPSPPQHGARPVRVHQSPIAAPADPLVEFRAASAALRAGNNREAAAAFTSFLVDHAGNPMAEDAAYLRVIALQRMGASDEMKRAAKSYLERFPSGFRHSEVERLTR